MKSILNKISGLLIYGNFIISLAAGAQAAMVMLKAGVWDTAAIIAITSGTFFIYNFQRSFDTVYHKGGFSEQGGWFAENTSTIRILSYISFAVFSFTAINMNIRAIGLLAVTGLMGLAYAVPFLNKGFRHVPLIKIFYISLVWAVVTVIVPLIETGAMSPGGILEAGIVFIFIFALTIPFDIRDVYTDPDKLKTIPQIFGLKPARVLSIALLAAFLFLSWYQSDNFEFDSFWADLALTFPAAAALIFSSPEKRDFYFLFIIDGMIILRLILYLIVK